MNDGSYEMDYGGEDSICLITPLGDAFELFEFGEVVLNHVGDCREFRV